MRMDFHHPLFRSLALPLLLAFAATGLLRAALPATQGRRWAAAGTAFAILATASWVLGGWRWLPNALTQKLPWALATATLLGIGLQAMRAYPRTAWFASAFLWALLLVMLGGAQPLFVKGLAWGVGAAVLAIVLSEPQNSAGAPAMLALAGLGLAAVAMAAGSALLFELSLLQAAAVAGCALWLWPVARIGFGTSGSVVAAIAWLATAQGVALLTPVRPVVLLLLAGAFLSGPIVHRLSRGRGGAPWVAAVAALWVAAALAVALLTGSAVTPPAVLPDPYYTPRW
jgi:hypothetical protein